MLHVDSEEDKKRRKEDEEEDRIIHFLMPSITDIEIHIVYRNTCR